MTPTILLIVGGGLTIAIVVLLVLYNIERGRVLRSKEALRTKEADLLRIGKEQSDQRTDYEARLGEARKGHEDLVNKYSGFIDQDLAIAERTAKLEALDTRLLDLNKEQTLLQGHVNELGKTIELYEETLELQESGLYKPQFGFDISERYKNALELNYLAQRNMLKDDAAVICRTAWEVGGSKAEGKKMTTRYKKLMLYAFNGECDGLIAKVKWNNVVKVRERIIKAFETINKLGESHSIAIQDPFLSLRLEELALSFEYEEKRQQEKEEQRRIKEVMREEERAQRELERERQDAEDEERRHERALAKARAELGGATADEVSELEEKIRLLEEKVRLAHEQKERALSMAQQTKVGHIYVISNIGSFGDEVYKVGMTRRLEPLERIKELGDASVPFPFDVHAVIHSDNAPQLEAEIHREFAQRRINRINNRKEFFKVSLHDLATFVRKHTNADIEFTMLAEAKEYRETRAMLIGTEPNP